MFENVPCAIAIPHAFGLRVGAEPKENFNISLTEGGRKRRPKSTAFVHVFEENIEALVFVMSLRN